MLRDAAGAPGPTVFVIDGFDAGVIPISCEQRLEMCEIMLITHRVPLDETDEEFEVAQDRGRAGAVSLSQRRCVLENSPACLA